MGCSLLLFTLHPPQSLGPVAGLLTLTCSPFRCRSHLETHMGFGIGVATSVSFRVSVLGRLSAWDRLRLPTVSAGSGISAEKLVSKALVLVHSSLLTPAGSVAPRTAGLLRDVRTKAFNSQYLQFISRARARSLRSAVRVHHPCPRCYSSFLGGLRNTSTSFRSSRLSFGASRPVLFANTLIHFSHFCLVLLTCGPSDDAPGSPRWTIYIYITWN